MHNDKWNRRFLELAGHIGSWSRDPSSKVGCVIVRPDRTIASLGYNGLPRGVADDPERLIDRDTKNAMTVHAEMNAILTARSSLEGCTLYCNLAPCSHCAAAIIQAGIKSVVSWWAQPEHFKERWKASIEASSIMLREAGVSLEWMK